MKLNKKFNVQINITDLWGKYVLKFMYNSLRNTMIVNLRKNKLLQQVQKTELIN